VAFNLKMIGAILILAAGAMRIIKRHTEPAYTIALTGGVLLAISELGVDIL